MKGVTTAKNRTKMKNVLILLHVHESHRGSLGRLEIGVGRAIPSILSQEAFTREDLRLCIALPSFWEYIHTCRPQDND